MLATRNLRLAATKYVHPAYGVWSSNVKRLQMLHPSAIELPTYIAVACYSKDVKAAELSLKSKDSPLTSPPSTNSSTSTSVSKSPTSSIKNKSEEAKTVCDECSTGTYGDVRVKLPSKDQVEGFVFKFLVYFWDFTYYTFCLCRKLVEKYVINNSTVQQNFKLLQKRMEDARKEMKPK